MPDVPQLTTVVGVTGELTFQTIPHASVQRKTARQFHRFCCGCRQCPARHPNFDGEANKSWKQGISIMNSMK